MKLTPEQIAAIHARDQEVGLECSMTPEQCDDAAIDRAALLKNIAALKAREE